jgi:hypothetical protein
MPYASESDLYPEVVRWLDSFLRERFRRHTIIVRDTSRRPLKMALQDAGLIPSNKPEWQTYDILVDVTGFIVQGTAVEFAFVECKNQSLRLRDISQLLGYSRVALPVYSCIVSPVGVSSDVMALLKTYGRYDILEYSWPKGERAKSIVVGTWSEQQQGLDYASLIHSGHPLHDR